MNPENFFFQSNFSDSTFLVVEWLVCLLTDRFKSRLWHGIFFVKVTKGTKCLSTSAAPVQKWASGLTDSAHSFIFFVSQIVPEIQRSKVLGSNHLILNMSNTHLSICLCVCLILRFGLASYFSYSAGDILNTNPNH